MTVWFVGTDTIEYHPEDRQFARSVELGWRANLDDPNDAEALAWKLERLITDRLMEALP